MQIAAYIQFDSLPTYYIISYLKKRLLIIEARWVIIITNFRESLVETVVFWTIDI